MLFHASNKIHRLCTLNLKHLIEYKKIVRCSLQENRPVTKLQSFSVLEKLV
jgi:hypothetical protein